ncbi:hypothetical protein NQ318_022866 [Aromia moschata]|uniref:Transposase n=1 Tax=Aromia moschata TaxID=1265417 RepID=A0AAV8XIC4_9CUCU|nr:hypothetical protein NQ318_022866 [Aromia moschata]
MNPEVSCDDDFIATDEEAGSVATDETQQQPDIQQPTNEENVTYEYLIDTIIISTRNYAKENVQSVVHLIQRNIRLDEKFTSEASGIPYPLNTRRENNPSALSQRMPHMWLNLKPNSFRVAIQIVYLKEMHKITILQMIDYGDRTRTQAEVVRLFQEKYPELPPISQGTVISGTWTCTAAKDAPNKLSDDQKLDVMLMVEENPHTSSRQTASALNISHSSILRVLTENQMHPYKLVPTNELAEDDFDRRILFCEQIDDNTLQIENVLFSDESTFIFKLHGHVNRQNCR